MTLTIAAAAGGAGSAAAQDAADVAPPVARLVLTALPAVIGPTTGADGPATADEVAWRAVVEHTGTEPWARVDVTAELRAAVTTRSALRAALAGADVTPLLRRRSVAVTPRALAPGELGIAEGSVPLRGLAPAGDPGGVHPLRLRVIADGTEILRLDTAVVRLEATPAATLATTLVWPFTAPPLLDTGDPVADAAPTAELSAAVAPGGRLHTGLATLTGADPAIAAAVTLAPAAHLMEDLAGLAAAGEADDAADADADDAAAMLAGLRALAATGRAGPVVTPYAGTDLARLLAAADPAPAVDAAADPAASDPAASAARLAATAAFEGGRRLLPLAGRAPGAVTLLHGPTSRRALDLVGGAILVPHEVLDLPDPSLDPALGDPVRRVTAASGRITTAVVADPFLAEAVAGTARPAVAARTGGALAAAQEVVARSALLFLEAPGRTDRGLLLLVPPDLDPDPVAAAELVARLGAAPWLDLVAPATLIARSDAAATPRASLAEGAFGPAPRLATRLGAADAALRRTLATVAPDGEPPLLGGRTAAQLDDALLRAVGVATGAAPDPTAALDRALAALGAVEEAAGAALGPVAIAAADLTLTDGGGPLPLSVANGGALPLAVTVTLTGPAGLAWPEGRTRDVILPAGGDVALELPVAARGTGVFPVVVDVRGAGGGELGTATLTVRSTAVAGPALAGIAVAVAVMTGVGLVRQRRRGRRPAA